MTDVGNIINEAGGYPKLEHSTSRKRDPSELDMTDFLNLMVVQLQNQSIDNTMDTSDMLNQMVQMQMITALTNVTDASVMTYASSLVGKEVTIGVWDNGELEEKVVKITGSGLSNGKHVLFAGDDVYDLSSVMAVGRLPGKDEDGEDDKVEGTDKTEGDDKTESGNKTEGSDKTESGNKTEGTDKTESTDKTGTPGETTGTEQTGTTSRRLTDAELDAVKDFLRGNGVDISEDISNAELVELVNGILKSGQTEGKDTSAKEDTGKEDAPVQGVGDKEPVSGELIQALEELLKGSQVELKDGFTEADLLKALEELLKAQQTQNSANSGQQNNTQARARRIREVQLEEFT